MINTKTGFLRKEDFDISVVNYDGAWVTAAGDTIPILRYIPFENIAKTGDSWSSEIEEIHEEPTKDGWIDKFERQKVFQVLDKVFAELEKGRKNLYVLELGASSGYMIRELRQKFTGYGYIATDLFVDGLERSYKIESDIMHIQCDCTDIPIVDNAIYVLYALNMLEHVEDDRKAISESYRILNTGGYCLYVVPRGERLYDYFDEMLFHKRRYAKGELRKKVEEAGFEVVADFHFAWVCYPIFWLKKKWNRVKGKHMTQEKKLQMVEADIKNATSSWVAKALIHVETILGDVIHPPFGVREFILCRK